MIAGFILLDKNQGMGCRKIDNSLQKRFKTKVGHLGTLDNFATGLLLIACGEATKLLPLIKEDYKTYIAKLKLGVATDTLDLDGKIIEEQQAPHFSKDTIVQTLSSFLGKSKQIPPAYSAKWINGRRAFDLVREGIDFDLKPIDIEIKEIELLEYKYPTIDFRVTISKGGYIRSLGNDIATRLNTIGHLTSLRRIKVGTYDIEQCKSLDEVTEQSIIPMNIFLKEYPTIELSEVQFKKAVNGAYLRLDNVTSDYCFVSYNSQIIAIYFKSDDIFKCYRGLYHASV